MINLAKPAEVGGESGGGCLMVTGFEGTAGRRRRAAGVDTTLLTGLGGQGLGEASGAGWS